MLKARTILVCMLLATSWCIAISQQQADPAAEAASTITEADLSVYLNVLASDEFEGRETGTEGNDKAARYIAEQFEAFGIPPLESTGDYFQEVQFTRMRLTTSDFIVNGVPFKYLKEFVTIPSQMPVDNFEFDVSEIVFAGYGIDDSRYSDYADEELSGKVLLIYSGEPVNADGISQVTGTSELSEWSSDIDMKLEAAKGIGARALIIVEPEFRDLLNRQRRFIMTGGTMMGAPADMSDKVVPSIRISSDLLEAMLGKKTKKVIKARNKMQKKGKSKTVEIPVEIEASMKRQVRTTPGVNVCGYIEGSDPVLREEVVIVTAHYDHIGTRGDLIFNGADDNGSGTSGVMEIAQAMIEAKKAGHGPRRSVLCMLVTGEEKGLLGSQYYSENPIFPLESTVANVNIDMIGRTDQKYGDNPGYVYVIGSDRLSTELHEINEKVNDKYTSLTLDYTYNAKDDPNQFYYRSDHYNFAKKGIPAIFFFSGVHEDYHKATDTVDKIRFDKAVGIARLAFHVAWELASRDKRIEVDVKS